MDIVDLLLQSHEVLRSSVRSLVEMLGRESGVGWEDRASFDKRAFARTLDEFIAAFRAHEADEDAFLSRVVRQLWLDREMDSTIAEGHRALGEMTHLFGAVLGASDGEHVYRLRTVLFQLNEELERHLAYEEGRVFPKLRERLPAGLLKELGRRAVARRRAAPKSRRRTAAKRQARARA